MGWSDWAREVEVEPSLYGADLARLGEQVDELLDAGVHVFHFDVGDGHFVDPITMGPTVLQAISERIHRTGAAVDVHLMVEHPAKCFEPFAKAGGDSVTFHVEAVDDVAATAAVAREHGLEVGLAFKPATEPAAVAAVADAVDIVLCMSIEPGYSGQRFMPEALARIAELRRLLPPGQQIQVDGGIGPDNVRAVHDAGATLLVAGSAIFGREDLPRAYRRLVHELA